MHDTRLKYRALVGLNYPNPEGGEFRAEPGDVLDDLPHKSIQWLMDQGCIEHVQYGRDYADERGDE